MATTVRTSIVIDRPVQAVWAYLDDHTNETTWRRPSLKELHQVGSGQVGAGTQYEGVITVGPGQFPYVNELTRYEPPNRVSWKAVSSAGWVIGSQGSYILEAEDGRTRMTHELTFEPNNFGGRVLMPLLNGMGSRAVMPLLTQLKQAIEQH